MANTLIFSFNNNPSISWKCITIVKELSLPIFLVTVGKIAVKEKNLTYNSQSVIRKTTLLGAASTTFNLIVHVGIHQHTPDGSRNVIIWKYLKMKLNCMISLNVGCCLKHMRLLNFFFFFFFTCSVLNLKVNLLTSRQTHFFFYLPQGLVKCKFRFPMFGNILKMNKCTHHIHHHYLKIPCDHQNTFILKEWIIKLTENVNSACLHHAISKNS